MSSLASAASQNDPENNDLEETDLDTGESMPEGDQETKWEVVTETAGLTTAEIFVGRLKAEGIPARAWQEGAGQAFGLTVGMLGTGYVLVPESYLERAKVILETPYDLVDEESDDEATLTEE